MVLSTSGELTRIVCRTLRMDWGVGGGRNADLLRRLTGGVISSDSASALWYLAIRLPRRKWEMETIISFEYLLKKGGRRNGRMTKFLDVDWIVHSIHGVACTTEWVQFRRSR